jgi:hypothetical protein
MDILIIQAEAFLKVSSPPLITLSSAPSALESKLAARDRAQKVEKNSLS